MTPGEREPLRVGVVGVGALAQLVHLPILTERDDVVVRAVSDPARAKAETIGARFDVGRVCTDEELFADPEIDAVVVSTPNARHQEQVLRAVDGGKDVLVERPLAFDARGVEKVLAAAREAGRLVFVGMSHRYRPDVGALRSFVAGGELGDIYAIRVAWLNRKVPLARITWRQSLEEAGGGVLMDLGIQALDLCLWMVDYPEADRVRCVTRMGEHGVEASASLMVTGGDGLSIQVEVTSDYYAADDRRYFRVMGSEGSGSLPPLRVHKRLGGRPMDVTPDQPEAPRTRENPFTSAYRRQLDHFVRAVTGEAEAALPEEQIQLMALVRAAYRSAERGVEVAL